MGWNSGYRPGSPTPCKQGLNDMKWIKWSLRENALIVDQILLTTCDSFKECIEISLENLYVDTGA